MLMGELESINADLSLLVACCGRAEAQSTAEALEPSILT